MRIPEVASRLRDLGANDRHVAALLRAWAEGRPLDRGVRRATDFLPARVREALASVAADLGRLAQVVSEHPDDAGAVRFLVALADGRTVETVLLPRDGLCVSTQIGCAVGCAFCMTGRDGLIRQLGSAEIVAQVLIGRARRAVRKVVFMGMGEPAHNLDNVMEAIEFLGTYGGIGHRNLVFSTVGDRRAFERLPQGRVKPALALSLHTTRNDLRERLLPRAPRITPEELVGLADDYSRATRYPVQYQWTLLESVNDTDEEVEGIVRLLAGKYAVLNFIPFNVVEGSGFRRPDWARAAELVRALHRRGVLAKLRHSAGQAVDGGCGQLRARSLAEVPTRAV